MKVSRGGGNNRQGDRRRSEANICGNSVNIARVTIQLLGE